MPVATCNYQACMHAHSRATIRWECLWGDGDPAHEYTSCTSMTSGLSDVQLLKALKRSASHQLHETAWRHAAALVQAECLKENRPT